MREILIHRRVAIRIALLSRNFNFKSDCSSIAIYESEDFITPDYRPLIKKINYDVLWRREGGWSISFTIFTRFCRVKNAFPRRLRFPRSSESRRRWGTKIYTRYTLDTNWYHRTTDNSSGNRNPAVSCSRFALFAHGTSFAENIREPEQSSLTDTRLCYVEVKRGSSDDFALQNAANAKEKIFIECI